MAKKTQASPPIDDRPAAASDEEMAATKLLGGSKVPAFNMVLVNQVIDTLWSAHSTADQAADQRMAAMTVLASIAPNDEVEGMYAAQMVAIHSAAMESLRRAMLGEQTFEGRNANLSQANKLSRTFALLQESLDKKRGKGQQKVTVEHVHVHSGGQAVVGMVAPQGGGVSTKTEEQPHAKQIAYAPQPALWGMHETGEPLHVASDEERPLPDARRKRDGRTKG